MGEAQARFFSVQGLLIYSTESASFVTSSVKAKFTTTVKSFN